MRRKPPSLSFWRGRKPSALLLAIGLVAFLAACNGPLVPDPDPEPGRPTLSVTDTNMNGVTERVLTVRAAGAWQLSVESSLSAMADAVRLTPRSGRGNATVALKVDPKDLAPDDYSFVVRLRTEGPDASLQFAFSFPDVSGRVVVIDQRSSALDSSAVLAPAPLAVPPASARDHAPPNSAGSVTLIVGLEAADAQLRMQNAAGPPSLSAQAAVRNTLSALGSQAAVTDSFDAAGVVLVEVAADGADGALALLRATPGVRYVELPVPLYSLANDPYLGWQWNIKQLGVEALWSEVTGDGVTIAIIDNGFYPDHPDLAGNITGTYDAGEKKTDVTVTNPACVVGGAHGTHVAGIAAAVTDNFIGVAGVAPDAKLLLVDIDDSRLSDCPMTSDALIRALEHVTNNGSPLAEVINMSIGQPGDLGSGVFDALTAAHNAGITLVAAAGNSLDRCELGGKTSQAVMYPAAYPMVLAVGATRPSGDRACYSTIGPNLFIMAPGGEMFRPLGTSDGVFSTDYDLANDRAGYRYMQGTSMAAPAVAGVIALLLEAKPSAAAGEVVAALRSTAIDMGPAGHDSETGYGFMNPAAAYTALTSRPSPEPPPEQKPLILKVPGYYDEALDADGLFTVPNAPPGSLTIKAGTNDSDNKLGGSGELYGEETVDVAFDQRNTVEITVRRVR